MKHIRLTKKIKRSYYDVHMTRASITNEKALQQASRAQLKKIILEGNYPRLK